MTEWVTSHTVSINIEKRYPNLSSVSYNDTVLYHNDKFGLFVEDITHHKIEFLLENHLDFRMDALIYEDTVLAYVAKVELSDTKAVEYKLKFG